MIGSDYFDIYANIALEGGRNAFVYGNHFSFENWFINNVGFVYLLLFQYLNKFIFMRFSKVVSMVFADNTGNKMQSSTLAFAGTKMNLTKKSCHLLGW